MDSTGDVVMGDAELTARFAAGEAGSVAEVYRAYGRLVYAVAYRVLGDASLAEDATQQAFVQAWQNAAGFDPDRNLAPWLTTIARRAAIDILRRNRRHRDHGNIDALTRTEPELSSPPPSLEQIDEMWQVRRAVDTLPDEDRELIRLQHYGELTHREIADQLAIPLGTVKSRSFRAHHRLAGLLGQVRAESDAGPGVLACHTDCTC